MIPPEHIRVVDFPVEIYPQSRRLGTVGGDVVNLNDSVISSHRAEYAIRTIVNARKQYPQFMVRFAGDIFQAINGGKADHHKHFAFLPARSWRSPFVSYRKLDCEWIVEYQWLQTYCANKYPCTLFNSQGGLCGLNTGSRIVRGSLQLIYGLRHSDVYVISGIRKLLGSISLVASRTSLDSGIVHQFVGLGSPVIIS